MNFWTFELYCVVGGMALIAVGIFLGIRWERHSADTDRLADPRPRWFDSVYAGWADRRAELADLDSHYATEADAETFLIELHGDGQDQADQVTAPVSWSCAECGTALHPGVTHYCPADHHTDYLVNTAELEVFRANLSADDFLEQLQTWPQRVMAEIQAGLR